ncbi:MAG: Flp pilus assembly complex ATPase component TadA, partial [Gemmatimonadetes bacterium]|nr:Flp pilus assembly complex ATPase component TadA [Gemmatimonadota bacterium]
MTQRPKILGQLLVDDGVLTAEQLQHALEDQRNRGGRLGEVLVRCGLATEDVVARTLARQLGLPFAPSPLVPDKDAPRRITESLARSRCVLPLRSTRRGLAIAMVDPLDLGTVDDIQFQTGCRIEPHVAEFSAVVDALDRCYGGSLEGLVASLPDELKGPGVSGDANLELATRAAPVVRLVDRVIREAVEAGASDIHVEETGADVRVRYRIDGVLRQAVEIPGAARQAVLSRLKVIAGMDISVRRRAQDGRIAFTQEGRTLTMRVSTLPVNGGEKAVVRILDHDAAPESLEGLGMAAGDLRRIRRLLASHEGVILAAGPTGSGKSTTLFAALSELDRERQNVVTLEDPVEYRLQGANQVQV